ncbi:hypothetical protein QUC32_12330 [Novosphingobium resinovorum]|uniref:hypothetical protein n=1 Tax=Novosphingobium TaxID=165696 RepID=UPI001B3C6793|nr:MULTISPECIES: hypothetical protein [Novosphingobium]MBF7010462.1 hypothetical protein [Novosphingobium sp. HR1a]WJM28463.1 hypothetical protein QUC32_12330 [Novosphingobium resinovorum]
MLTGILNSLRGYRRQFDALENAIFAEVRGALPEMSKSAFDDRLRRVNVIQPILGRTEVNFFERRKGQIFFPTSSRILSTDESIRIATVKSEATDNLSRFTVGVYCANGVLTSLEFDKPTEHSAIENITSITASFSPDTPWA